MRCSKSRLLFFTLLTPLLLTVLTGTVVAAPASDAGATPVAPSGGAASGVSKFEDLGTDLVVSKVKFTRGRFAGQNKVQVTPYVKNMCNEGTSVRFDVYIPFVIKMWVTGIGAKQEKSAGVFYRSDNPDQPKRLSYNVSVDHDNKVTENNNANNTCNGASASFRTGEMGSKTYSCSIVNPTCKSRSILDKERQLQIRPR
jgi:hypothetical protein